jgi:predicted histidine transporter YuiF (NhaC family)
VPPPHNHCWDTCIPTSFVSTIVRMVARPSIKS